MQFQFFYLPFIPKAFRYIIQFNNQFVCQVIFTKYFSLKLLINLFIVDAELTELLIPEMSGDGFLELPCLEGVAKAFSIEVWFLTHASDGVLLYNGQLNNGRGDFISLNLVQGKLEFRFNLGSGIANITSPDTVSLDTWHCVRISRLGREGVLQLDDGTVARGLSGSPLTELNLEMPLYVGGVK